MRVRIAISGGCVIDKGEGSLIFLSGWSPMGEATSLFDVGKGILKHNNLMCRFT